MDLPGPRIFEIFYIYLPYFWVYIIIFSIFFLSSARSFLLDLGLVKKKAI